MDIPFNPEGGPVEVEVISGFAQPGSYTFLLWKAGSNSVLWRQEGNFLNPADDRYTLPGGADEQAGRIVECITTLVLVPPLLDWSVTIRYYQGGVQIGENLRYAQGSAFQTITVDQHNTLVGV